MTHADLVVEALARLGPSSDYTIFHYVRGQGVKASPSSTRTRRSELFDSGRVRRSVGCEVTPAGRRAALWELA